MMMQHHVVGSQLRLMTSLALFRQITELMPLAPSSIGRYSLMHFICLHLLLSGELLL